MPAINITTGTGSTTIVSTSASERFWIRVITIVPDASGVFALYSGSNRLTGDIAGVAGVAYSFFDLDSVDVGDDFVITRTGAMAIGGSYSGRVA